MKLFSGLLVLFLAILISGVAAYFSVIGLAALFSAAFLPVVIMGTSLEAGKLAAAQWLKSNWHNKKVGVWHKTYLMSAVFVLMVITGLGIYGFLSKGHLEQNAPMAGIQLQIDQKEGQLSVLKAQNERLNEKLRLLDSNLDVFLRNDRATLAVKERANQQAERKAIEDEIDGNFAKMQEINAGIAPLKLQTSEVEAKLGPIKYVADLLELEDPESAVRMVILLLMFAFDPLAIVLLLSGTMTLGEHFENKRIRREEKEERDRKEREMIPPPPAPKVEPIIAEPSVEKPEPVAAAKIESAPEVEKVIIVEEIHQPTTEEIDLLSEIVQSGVMPDEVQKEIVPVIRKARRKTKNTIKVENVIEQPVTEAKVDETVEPEVEIKEKPMVESVQGQSTDKTNRKNSKDSSWLNAGK